MSSLHTRLMPILCLLLFGLLSCHSMGWHPIAQNVSPSGNITVSIHERCVGPDCIIQIRRTKGSDTSVLLDERADRLPTAALVAWSDDAETVAAAVCDRVAGNLFVAFDVSQGSRVDPAI